MKKLRKFTKKLLCAVLAVFMASCATLSASAEDIDIFQFFLEGFKKTFTNIENTTTVSSDNIFLGESVTFYGSIDGVDPDLCLYSFYVRRNLFSFDTLQEYSTNRYFEWTPEESGEYEILVKIRYGLSVYKKSITITVMRELFNDSLLSSSFVQHGDSVELIGKASGGEGDISYGFFYKDSFSEEWSALSNYSAADSIKWRPKDIGTYDICIKVKDAVGQLKKKYFTLTVADVRTKSPTEFSLTVKAPITSPYFWRCSFSSENILNYTVTQKPAEMQELRMYVLIEYRFRTVSAGKTDVRLVYNTYGGTEYNLDYVVSVDKNLNYTVESAKGSYMDKDIPKPQQQKTDFAVAVKKAGIGYRWKFDISNSAVVHYVDCDASGHDYDIYYFCAVREGFGSIKFTCNSVSEMSDKYMLVYNISSDADRMITVTDYDGYYEENEPLPEIYIVRPDEN